MAAHVHESSVVSARAMLFIGIVGAHLLALSVLMQQRLAVERTHEPPIIRGTFFDPPPRVADPVPKAPPSDVGERRVLLPDVPGPKFDVPADDPPVAITTRVSGPPGETAPPRPEVPATALTYTSLRNPNEVYPPASIRLGEHGVTIVRVCVGPDSRIQGTPTVQRSSGYPRLDAAAVRWAGEALRFQPATRNGEAVAACQGFRVLFDLH